MSVRHHPGEELLLDYASGAADEGLALIVAVHLCYCADCRRTVAVAEAAGGALLDETAPLGAGALEAVLARLDDAVAEPAAPPSRDGTPSPLRPYLGGDLSGVRWRGMGPNLAFANLFRRGATRVRLLKGAPGADTGTHGHHGLEYTLVLAGGFTDETGSYAAGDLQVATPQTLHNPVADPGGPCINLAVTTAPLRFTTIFQRFAAKLFGF
jgi:putative transcriptional regulator